MKDLLPKEDESKEQPRRDVLLVSETRPPLPQQPTQRGPEVNPLRDPFFGIGESDLDPFGRIGSGTWAIQIIVTLWVGIQHCVTLTFLPSNIQYLMLLDYNLA